MLEKPPAALPSQVAVGTVHVPVTVEYETGFAFVPDATYPDQLGLTCIPGPLSAADRVVEVRAWTPPTTRAASAIATEMDVSEKRQTLSGPRVAAIVTDHPARPFVRHAERNI